MKRRQPRKLLTALFGASRDLPSELTSALEQLDKLTASRGLSKPADLLRDVLLGMYQTPPSATVQLTESDAAKRLEQGVPLLRGAEVDCDSRAMRDRWRLLCKIIARHDPTIKGSVRQLERLLDKADWSVPRILHDVLNGASEQIMLRATAEGLDAAKVTTLLRFTLFPEFCSLAATLEGRRSPAAWSRGYCPTCGAWPALAEHRGLEQLRHLRCALCASDWAFPRLVCPYCDNADHERLGFVHVAGEQEQHRVATCDACRQYLKTVATLTPLTPPQLWVVDLATMHLDLTMSDRGFLRPA